MPQGDAESSRKTIVKPHGHAIHGHGSANQPPHGRRSFAISLTPQAQSRLLTVMTQLVSLKPQARSWF